MALSKIGINGVTHWRSKREDDFLFSLFSSFVLNLTYCNFKAELCKIFKLNTNYQKICIGKWGLGIKLKITPR